MLYNVNYNKIETGFHIYTAELCRCIINNVYTFFSPRKSAGPSIFRPTQKNIVI